MAQLPGTTSADRDFNPEMIRDSPFAPITGKPLDGQSCSYAATLTSFAIAFEPL
jgi:hypothetical protein